MPPPTLTLVDCDLWNQFHHQQNEMIITKSGRCLFPALRLRAAGLIPTAEYSVHLDLEQLVPNRFKYCDGNWESLSNEVFALKETSKNTPKDNPKETPEKISETAPKKTFEDLSEKMSEKIFEKNPEKAPERMHEKAPKEKSDMIPRELNIKIVKDSFMKSTVKSADDSPGRKSERNLGSIEPGASADKGTTDPSNSISRNITMVETGIFHVNSFHKYRPRIILRQHSDNSSRVLKEKTFKFDATTFMAVTHYQNEKVNDLKKLHNPHARGERGKTKPRKALQPIEEPMNHRHNITNNPIRKRPFSEQSSRVSKRARQNQSEEETSRSRAYHGMRSQGNQNGENELPQNPSYFNRQVQQNQTKEETPRSPAYRGLRFQGYQNSENEISQSTLYFNKRARQNQSEEETPQSLAYRGMRRHGSQNGENVTSQSPSSFNKRLPRHITQNEYDGAADWKNA
ncbi:hypothetical protein FBU30_003884 [Linnemannia zychae]|nr:hypothetical protein FBU30_003884 [Linnemannia zychae]